MKVVKAIRKIGAFFWVNAFLMEPTCTAVWCKCKESERLIIKRSSGIIEVMRVECPKISFVAKREIAAPIRGGKKRITAVISERKRKQSKRKTAPKRAGKRIFLIDSEYSSKRIFV